MYVPKGLEQCTWQTFPNEVLVDTCLNVHHGTAEDGSSLVATFNCNKSAGLQRKSSDLDWRYEQAAVQGHETFRGLYGEQDSGGVRCYVKKDILEDMLDPQVDVDADDDARDYNDCMRIREMECEQLDSQEVPKVLYGYWRFKAYGGLKHVLSPYFGDRNVSSSTITSVIGLKRSIGYVDEFLGETDQGGNHYYVNAPHTTRFEATSTKVFPGGWKSFQRRAMNLWKHKQRVLRLDVQSLVSYRDVLQRARWKRQQLADCPLLKITVSTKIDTKHVVPRQAFKLLAELHATLGWLGEGVQDDLSRCSDPSYRSNLGISENSMAQRRNLRRLSHSGKSMSLTVLVLLRPSNSNAEAFPGFKLEEDWEYNVRVHSIQKRTSAERAGFDKGDIIYRIGGTVVKNSEHANELISGQHMERTEIDVYRIYEEKPEVAAKTAFVNRRAPHTTLHDLTGARAVRNLELKDVDNELHVRGYVPADCGENVTQKRESLTQLLGFSLCKCCLQTKHFAVQHLQPQHVAIMEPSELKRHLQNQGENSTGGVESLRKRLELVISKIGQNPRHMDGKQHEAPPGYTVVRRATASSNNIKIYKGTPENYTMYFTSFKKAWCHYREESRT